MTYARYLIIIILSPLLLQAQTQDTVYWDLATCINYAFKNNIQVQKSWINYEQNAVNTKLAKAQLLPSLSGSVGQNYTNRPFLEENSLNSTNSYNGSYGLNASMTLFRGGYLLKNIEQQKLYEEASIYGILEVEKSIELAILQYYVQILYAQEAINVYREMIELSEYQLTRGQALLTAGLLSRVDVAQLEAQVSSDRYQLIAAENTLQYAVLQLKQLLELDIDEEIQVATPEIDDEEVLKPIPGLYDVYFTSLAVMPQMKSSQLYVDIAELEISKARAGYYPRVSLSASAGSSHVSGTGLTWEEQMRYNFNDGVGISVTVPIYSNRENKSAVEKAKLSEMSAQLDLIDTQKNLLREVELAHQDAISAQSQYIAASESVRALETSFELVQQQYNLGLKNTLELLIEKNNLLQAQQNLLQAKYMSVMNAQILNLYQDIPLRL